MTAKLEEKGMSRADLARATGCTPEQISRALNDTGGRGGKIPDVWAAILEATDMHLEALPGREAPQTAAPPKGKPGRKPIKASTGEGRSPQPASAPASASSSPVRKPAPSKVFRAAPGYSGPALSGAYGVLKDGGYIAGQGAQWALYGRDGAKLAKVPGATLSGLKRGGVVIEVEEP